MASNLHNAGRTPIPQDLASPQPSCPSLDERKRPLVATFPPLYHPSSLSDNGISMSSAEEKNIPGLTTSELPSHTHCPATNLSLFKRFFCLPNDPDPEKAYAPENRTFSLRSPGAIVSAFMLLLLLLPTIIAPVLARKWQQDHSHTHHHDSGNYSLPSGPTGATGSAAGLLPASIVSLGLYASFADPFILQHNGTWYAYATSNAVGIWGPDRPTYLYDRDFVQMATSTDFQNWTLGTHAAQPLSAVGVWAQQGNRKPPPNLPEANVWAPSVFQRPKDNKWIMYYSAQSSTWAWTHCIGAALADSPLGPFAPLDQVFACPYQFGGAIDPSPFIDQQSGDIHIVYKVDGNSRGHGGQCGNTRAPIKSTPIMLQKTLSDGTTPSGDPVKILDRSTADHDGPLVEAPSLVRSDEGIYFLFFSSGCTRNANYNIKYAWARNIEGPYTRAEYPLLHTQDFNLLAPGSATVTRGADEIWRMAFHARVYTNFGAGLRMLFTTALHLNGTTATLYAETDSPYNSTANVAAAAGAVEFASDSVAAPLGNHNDGNLGGADVIKGGGKVPEAGSDGNSPDASAGTPADIDGNGGAGDPTNSTATSSAASTTTTLATLTSSTASASPSASGFRKRDIPPYQRLWNGQGQDAIGNINGRD